jgi:short-subunit dehydrogenase
MGMTAASKARQAPREGEGRTVVVTGASAGIGAAFARQFAREGFRCVLVARRRDRLELLARELQEQHRVEAVPLTADLSEPDAPRRIADTLAAQGLAVDALVNNAGYGVPGSFRSASWRTHADFLQVLVTSVAHLTHLLEPGMTERRYGRILNVASVAGLLPGSAGHTLYGASKAFIIKFSESLALEHAGDNVHVTAVCPGLTYSEFHDVTGTRALVSRLPRFVWMDADTVARQGYRAVMEGRPLLVNGPVNTALSSVMRLVPESLALSLMKWQGHRFRAEE